MVANYQSAPSAIPNMTNILILVCVLVSILVLVMLIALLYKYIEANRGYPSNWCNSDERKKLIDKIELEEMEHTSEREKTLNAPCGLKNDSSVCYINSMVQAAASSDILIKQIKAQEKNLSLFKFVNLLSGINESGNYMCEVEKKTQMLETLITSVGWKKPSQQDAFDLFSALVKEIQEGIKNLGEFQMPMKLKLVHRFKGMGIPDKVQDHLGLSVGLCGDYSKKPGVTLEYLIEEHLAPTIIDDDPSKTTQMFFHQQAPDVLLIHIQANKWNDERGEMVKPEYYIIYNQEMTLSVNIVSDIGSDILKTEVNYKLKSVVHHLGTISRGHYVTYRKYNGNWFIMNDEDVRRVEFDEDVVPYIMIYEKEDRPA